MGFEKLRYYLAGIIMLTLALICVLAFTQQVYLGNVSRRVLLLDIGAFVITFPLGIIFMQKAKRME
jgi:hypothetical protein